MRDERDPRAANAFTFTLTGWKAVVFILVIVAFGAFRFTRARAALDGDGRGKLEAWIVGEIQRPLLADATLGLAEKGAALLVASTAVGIRTLDARGPFDDVQVRVELEPDPALPPGFELVRYYRMRYSSLTGWSHKGRGSALSYWLAFL
ncbi:MAG TPA: hypothetical protein VLH75_16215 [Longimicrobiales bacterium]|nr:hypothetical protein [Longimicrobiales bacterium]